MNIIQNQKSFQDLLKKLSEREKKMPIPSEDSKVAPFTKEIKTIYNPWPPYTSQRGKQSSSKNTKF